MAVMGDVATPELLRFEHLLVVESGRTASG
jgi:hypothetical protein